MVFNIFHLDNQNLYQECYVKCIEEQYISQYQCLPNPFIHENFKLINSNQTEHRICDQNINDFKINENNCEKICIKDCNEMYFSTRFDNSFVLHKKVTNLWIKYRSFLEYEYTSEHKYSFVDYMSNIGGLFGLWFGITFIDMSQWMKMILGKFEDFVFTYIRFRYIFLLIANTKAIRKINIIFSAGPLASDISKLANIFCEHSEHVQIKYTYIVTI